MTKTKPTARRRRRPADTKAARRVRLLAATDPAYRDREGHVRRIERKLDGQEDLTP